MIYELTDHNWRKTLQFYDTCFQKGHSMSCMTILLGSRFLIRISSSSYFITQSFTMTTILYETSKGNKKRHITVNKIAGKFSQVECSALLVLHEFTGCATCSAFKGLGEVKPINSLQKNAKFNVYVSKAWRQLGNP